MLSDNNLNQKNKDERIPPEEMTTNRTANVEISTKNMLNLENNCDISDKRINDNWETEELIVQRTVEETHTKEMIDNKENQFVNRQSKKILFLKKPPVKKRTSTSTLAKFVEQNEENTMEIVKAEEFDKRFSESSSQNKMRLAISLLLKLVIPLANGVASRLKGFRGDRIWRALRSLGASRINLSSLFASVANTISMGLSSVQVSHRIDPILKIMKLRRDPSTPMLMYGSPYDDRLCFSVPLNNQLVNIPRLQFEPELYETAEQCITVNILAEPPAGTPIRADIILIHGLHGSLPNTWKQGIWSNDRNPVDFVRPPKPPLRPPKRPRHSRSNIFVPPHTNKKIRLGDDIFQSFDDDDFIFGSTENLTNNSNYSPNSSTVNSSHDSFSFSTFRLRLEDFECVSRPTSPTSLSQSSKTSNYDKNNQPYSSCWPGEWLPLDCPGVRVIAVNYTTDKYLWRPIWIKKHHRSSMTERVRIMTEKLIELKVGIGHPIVWVGHSKGGLFIKQILVDAWESGKPAAAPLLRSSRGVFFYSVPHRGSALADINLPFVHRSIELIEIEKNSKVLLDLHRRFVGLYYSGHLKIEVFSFVETALTFMQFLYLRIVGVDSADPGIGDVCGLQLDHREICKPRSRNCMLYTELVKMIQKVS